MKKIALLVLSLTVLLSCNSDNSDETGSLDLEFQLKYQGEPLVMNKDYTFDEWKVFFSRFHFFISHVNLMGKNGDFPVREYEKISFTDPNLDSAIAAEGLSYIYEGVKTGEYSGIRFGIGLDEQTNAKSNADFESSHPLSNAGDYWEDWDSYIFTKTEGQVFLEEGQNPEGFAFHTGGNEAYREVTFPGQIYIDPNHTTRITFSVDLFEVLQNGDKPIDLSEHRRSHTTEHNFLIEEIMNHLQASIQRTD